MKILKYKFLSAVINRGTEEEPNLEEIILEKSMPWNEDNEKVAKMEAYSGQYVIEDDGESGTEDQITQAERITELEEALEMILSGVVK